MQEDDAPLDRTSDPVTQADLFDTAYWLDRRIAALRDGFGDMQTDSGEITDKIMGDLAGIRAEQIYLSRRLELLSAELRADIRKELDRASAAEIKVSPGPMRRTGRGGWILQVLLIATIVTVLLAALWMALISNSFGLPDSVLEWMPQMDWLPYRRLLGGP